jgi:hypothetical protein
LIFAQEETLGFKVSHLAQRQGNLKMSLIGLNHGRIEPVTAKGRLVMVDRADNFPVRNGGIPDIGSQPSASPVRLIQCQGKRLGVASKFKNRFSGRRGLFEPVLCGHVGYPLIIVLFMADASMTATRCKSGSININPETEETIVICTIGNNSATKALSFFRDCARKKWPMAIED